MMKEKMIKMLNERGWEVEKLKEWKTYDYDYGSVLNIYIKIKHKTGEVRSYKGWFIAGGWALYRGYWKKEDGKWVFIKYYKQKFEDYDEYYENRGEYDDEIDSIIRKAVKNQL